MPHVTIDYSANVADHHDIDALVSTVHGAVLDHGAAPMTGLRTRAFAATHYRIADGRPDLAYVALRAHLGPGRSAEVKRSLVTAVLDAAEARLATEPSPLAIAWSMEVTEIDAELRENRNHVRSRIEGGGA